MQLFISAIFEMCRLKQKSQRLENGEETERDIHSSSKASSSGAPKESLRSANQKVPGQSESSRQIKRLLNIKSSRQIKKLPANQKAPEHQKFPGQLKSSRPIKRLPASQFSRVSAAASSGCSSSPSWSAGSAG